MSIYSNIKAMHLNFKQFIDNTPSKDVKRPIQSKQNLKAIFLYIIEYNACIKKF